MRIEYVALRTTYKQIFKEIKKRVTHLKNKVTVYAFLFSLALFTVFTSKEAYKEAGSCD